MKLDGFFEELDSIFRTKNIKDAEKYILETMKKAQEDKDLPALLAIANELGGIYRVSNRFDEAKKIYEIAEQLIQQLGLENTLQHGTTLLNIASVYAEADEPSESLKLYEKAASIYEKAGLSRDYRLAALYNNMSHIYDKLDMAEVALTYAEKSLSIIRDLSGYEVELATTCTTLASRYIKLNKYREALVYLKEADRIFERQPGKVNVHYAATLNSLGELCYHEGNFSEAANYYERALKIIKENYGENNAYSEVAKNLSIVHETLRQAGNRMTGLALAEDYYNSYGRDMINKGFSEYQKYMAIGLVGEGSECFGFDDALSESHDFGPGFCIWLPEDIYEKIGQKLKEAYEDLPKSHQNRQRIETIEGKGRVGVFSIQEFYRKYIGCSGEPKNNVEWLYAPETSYSTVTNGKVFEDHYGEFTRVRNEILKFYPRDIYLKKLAAKMAMMSQTGQYNYPRCMERGEFGAAYISCSEFVKNTVSIVYLLNRKYMPFYKWMFKGMDSLERLSDLKPMLEQLVLIPDTSEQKDKKIELIEAICILVGNEIRQQGIIQGQDTFLNNHCRHVVSLISDPKIRNLPVMFEGR